MRIKLSKSQWKEIGTKMGWLKTADSGTPTPSGGSMSSESKPVKKSPALKDPSVSEISMDELSSIWKGSKEIKEGPYYKERKICGHVFQSHNRSYREDGSVVYRGAIRLDPDLPEPQRSWPQNTNPAQVYVTPDNKTRILAYIKIPEGATIDKSTSHTFKEDGGRF